MRAFAGQRGQSAVQNQTRINAFILGGGKSRRLKSDKAFLQHRGRFFIDIVTECAASIFSNVYLVGKNYEHPQLQGSYPDDVDNAGPLGGILTALRRTDTGLNFFVALSIWPAINL